MFLYDLPSIREYVRGDFNQALAEGFISITDIDRWANEALMRYTTMLMQAHEGYFETTKTLNIVSGQEEVSLPTNFSNDKRFLKTTLLERVLPSSNVPLKFRKRYDEPNATLGVGGTTYVPTYKFRGNKIILEPTPGFSETGGLLLTFQALHPRLHSANAQAGASTTITLASTADPRDDYYNDQRIYIQDGLGSGQIRTISDYVGATKVATVSAAWDTNPDITSVYSTLVSDEFPENFLELIPLYACKKAFMKERSRGVSLSWDAQILNNMEKEFKDYVEQRTTARKLMQPWHPEIN